MKVVFSKSEGFKSEYSCAVVRIQELTPIEGSDFLAKTLVQGTQIVVSKDVKPGDIMIYAANETQLNEEFLSVNNQFDISDREKNANAELVESILKPYLDTKGGIDSKRQTTKYLKGVIDRIHKNITKIEKENKRIEKWFNEPAVSLEEEWNKKKEKFDKNLNELKTLKEIVEKNEEKYKTLKAEIAESVKFGEPFVTEAKKLCGFFDKRCRVRCIILRGEYSFGFLMPPSMLTTWDNTITMEDIEAYVGQEFDTINGKLFCKAYIPPVKEMPQRRDKNSKATKKLEKFDRLADNTFTFHYDTAQLQKNMFRINPDDMVTCTLKIHGTSICIGNLRVRYPKHIAFYKRLVNKICKWLKRPKHFIDFEVDYGPIYSSRTVLKNRFINPNVTKGYYDTDVWSEWGEVIYPYLDKGMMVYGEIFGKLNNDKYIQKNYDYGCDKDCVNKLMIYRITTLDEYGVKREWDVNEIYDWTMQLIERMKSQGDAYTHRIHPIDILYHGTLGDLYPNVDTSTHWNENVLEEMKKDTERFGMEGLEPLCVNKVAREGIVLRIDNDPFVEAFKLKCSRFLSAEAELYNSDDYADIEVTQSDY